MEKIKLLLQELQEIPSGYRLLQHTITAILLQIKKSDTVEEAQPYFDMLHTIEGVLSTLLFSEYLYLPDNLTNFINEYDRLDDRETKSYLFNKIKNDLSLSAIKDTVLNEREVSVRIKALEEIPSLFPMLHNEINNLILKIKECTSMQKAEHYFDLLQKVQDILPTIVSEDGEHISTGLRKFVYYEKKLDDSAWREELFNKIHNDQYYI